MTNTPAALPLADERPRPAGFEAPPLFYGIEAMRGIGVLVVMLFHAAGADSSRLIPGAYFIVDFFNAVSGFVLSHAYGARLSHDLGGLGFMRLRMIRIYPLHLFSIAILLVTNLWIGLHIGIAEPWLFLLSLVASTLLIPLIQPLAWRHHHPYPLNGSTWSLFWEILVNAFWSTLGPRLTDRLLAVFVIIGIAFLVLSLSTSSGLENAGAFGNFHVGGLRVVYGFFGGVAAYRLWARGYFAWLRLPIWGSVLALSAVLMLRPHDGTFAYDLMAAMIMPVIVFASSSQAAPRFSKAYISTGQLAYPIYILNFPVMLALDQLLPLFRVPMLTSAPIRIPLFIALTIGVSIAADRWVDHPARKWMTRRFVPGSRAHIPGDRVAAPSES